MKLKTIILSIFAIMAVASCSSSKSAISDSKFLVEQLNGTEYVSMGEEPASISFFGNMLHATVGGNIINANYTEPKVGELVLSMGLSTKMLVPDSFREDEFIAALNSVVAYKVEQDNVLFMNHDGDVVIVATKAK